MKTINEAIGGWLMENGTREQFAEQLGITSDTLRAKMNGSTDWKWGEVLAICELTGTALADLDHAQTRKEEA